MGKRKLTGMYRDIPVLQRPRYLGRACDARLGKCPAYNNFKLEFDRDEIRPLFVGNVPTHSCMAGIDATSITQSYA